MIKGEYLSDIIIAFALIDSADGSSLYIPEVRSGAFARIWNEVAAIKEKYAHLKVHISVGGGGADGFSDMANDPALRAAFTANVCDWLEAHDLDGVDIDWEYPVGPEWGQNIKSRPEDRQNYISLLGDLRNALDALGEETGKRYYLSTAVPASSRFITRNDVKAASDIVDRLKVMAYDYYGTWSGTTGHHASLYTNSRDTNRSSTDSAVRAYLNAGVKPEKIMLGAAFYGYVWRNVAQGSYAATPGLFQSGTSAGSISWTDIAAYLKPGSGYTRYWDSTAKAPFLYNGNRWISCTDHEQIRALTNYAKEQKLIGVFVWEYGHDMGADLLKTLAYAIQ
jgi:chitinase